MLLYNNINCADMLTVLLEYINLLCSVAKHNEYLCEATSHCCITSIWSNYILLAKLVSYINIFCLNSLLLCQHFCSLLFHSYYAKIYAGKIDLSIGISYAFAHRLCYKNSHAEINGILYSLKFLRVKIFADFEVF